MVLGMMVVVLSLTIESLMAWILQKLGRWQHARETWDDHDMLGDQLWRMDTNIGSLDLPKLKHSCPPEKTATSELQKIIGAAI